LPRKESSRFAILLGGLIVASVALFVVAVPAPAAQYFRYFSIIYPGANNTAALGINRAGVVVGAHADPGIGFVWQQGTFTTVLPPGASESSATGINTIGQIVGYYADSTGYHGFLFSAGNYSILDVPGAQTTYPSGINDSGAAVGQYASQTSNSGNWQGFLDVGGTFTSLNYPGALFTIARGINNSGQIVGFYSDTNEVNHAFIYNDGAFEKLFNSACQSSAAFGINSQSLIVGYCDDHAFVYNYSDHSYFLFNDPNGAAVAFAINDSGRVVGQYAANVAGNGFLAVPIE
jgi:probable HAF family extracellular repeat protein